MITVMNWAARAHSATPANRRSPAAVLVRGADWSPTVRGAISVVIGLHLLSET
jgi:hypothetical protein